MSKFQYQNKHNLFLNFIKEKGFIRCYTYSGFKTLATFRIKKLKDVRNKED